MRLRLRACRLRRCYIGRTRGRYGDRGGERRPLRSACMKYFTDARHRTQSPQLPAAKAAATKYGSPDARVGRFGLVSLNRTDHRHRHTHTCGSCGPCVCCEQKCGVFYWKSLVCAITQRHPVLSRNLSHAKTIAQVYATEHTHSRTIYVRFWPFSSQHTNAGQLAFC